MVQPETVVRWHRAGFRSFWRWKSGRRGGRPGVPVEIRQLIRDMSLANPLRGTSRIHGELLKLGIDVAGRALPSTWPGKARALTGLEDLKSFAITTALMARHASGGFVRSVFVIDQLHRNRHRGTHMLNG
jgi:hypothetical protein